MSLTYPLINGHTYSFASITLKVDDVPYLGISRVDYNESVESVAIYGSNPARLGRTVGKRKMTAEVEIQRREWNQLLPQLGVNFSRQAVQITVQYAEGETQPVITDSIEGYVVGVDASNSEGTDASTVKLTLDPTDILWGASDFDRVAAEGAPTAPSATFWLQNTDGIEGLTRAENPWDIVTLGGQTLPGVCRVSGLPMLAFDKKKAAGVDGATITVNGYLPGPIEIDVLIWTEAQYVAMKEVAPLIWRKPNKATTAKRLALSIVHPALTLWGITDVVVLGVSVPQDGPLQGTKLIKIKCVEYVPTKAKSKSRTAKGSSNAVLAPELVGGKNGPGEPPSKTGIHPSGPAETRKGGVS